ncbi:MAG TPA: FAD-dependent monooxygenase [Deltaproteobacteria bacterium]|nr:FAD-dependent monooxygenase [Deltaproteobacteria bacterium]
MSQTPPVVIVGAGPVGLALALALIHQGLPVVVLEQRLQIPNDLRATTVQPPVLEHLGAWGVLDEALAAGRRVSQLQYWDWPRRLLLAELDYTLIEGDTRCPFRLHLPQARLCEILLAAIERTRPGTVRFGHKVTSVVLHDDRAIVTTQIHGGGEETFTTPRLCGADGGHSVVRQAMGIELGDEGVADTFLACTADLDVLPIIEARLSRALAPASYLYASQDWALVMVMTDAVRFLFRAVPDPEVSLARDAINERMRRFLGAEIGGRLRGLGLYSVRQRVAPSWHQGPAALLGDAAHGNLPVGGTAMNEGILDAHHLAWALAEGTPRAMDAYSTQRRSCALSLEAQDSETWKALRARGIWRRFSRNQYLKRISIHPVAARAHLLRLSMLEDRIGGGAVPDLDHE